MKKDEENIICTFKKNYNLLPDELQVTVRNLICSLLPRSTNSFPFTQNFQKYRPDGMRLCEIYKKVAEYEAKHHHKYNVSYDTIKSYFQKRKNHSNYGYSCEYVDAIAYAFGLPSAQILKCGYFEKVNGKWIIQNLPHELRPLFDSDVVTLFIRLEFSHQKAILELITSLQRATELLRL